jgi:hypothetical protein
MDHGHYSDGDIVTMRWRVGRKQGRNLYAMRGSEPSDGDILFGQLDSEAIAANAVNAHNSILVQQGVLDG